MANPKPKYHPTPPANLPKIDMRAVEVWKAAGIRMALTRCKGGYIVNVS